MPVPIILDTDMALDDWMATIFLLQNPRAHVRAITVAATGEAHKRAGIRSARRLHGLTNAPPVPIAAGRTTPLQGKHSFPVFVRLIMDVRLGLSLPPARTPKTSLSATRLITQQLCAAETPLTIVALGPVTNLAEVLLEQPALGHRIARIYLMGGALNVPGNLAEITPRTHNHHAEWNVYIDPFALDVLMRSGVPLTLVPLDATNQVPLTPRFYQQCTTNPRTPGAAFTARLLRRIQPLLRGKPFYFWDPVTAVIAIYPEIATFQSRLLRVILDEGPECGRVIETPDGYDVEVCSAIDQAAFEAIFLATLAQR